MTDFKRYLFEYRFQGDAWGIEIMARSPQEAKYRVQALPLAQYKGEIALTVAVEKPSTLSKVLFAGCFVAGFAVAAFLGLS